MGILLVTTERRMQDAYNMWRDGHLTAEIEALNLTIDGVCCPSDIIPEQNIAWIEMENPDAASASFGGTAGQWQPHILLREVFFSQDPARQQFIMAHELRHAWQRLVSEEWIPHCHERERVIYTLAHNDEAVQQICNILSGPVEIDAECWAIGRYPANYNQRTKVRLLSCLSTVQNFPGASAHTMPVLADLLPEIYYASHSQYRKIVSKEVRALMTHIASELRSFVTERCRPRIAERDLIRIASQENPAAFLSATESLLRQLYA